MGFLKLDSGKSVTASVFQGVWIFLVLAFLSLFLLFMKIATESPWIISELGDKMPHEFQNVNSGAEPPEAQDSCVSGTSREAEGSGIGSAEVAYSSWNSGPT